MSQAIKGGQGYEEGTFVIEDPEGRLYSYLMSAPNGYERDSSHYKGRSAPKHRGVDIFNGKMPAHKRTLLFEKVTNPDFKGMPAQVLFLKPENFSADKSQAYDFAMHGVEFVAAQSNKLFYPGSDDLESMRKERVPAKELKEFNQLINILEKYEPEEGNTQEWLNKALGENDLGPLKNNLSFAKIKECAKRDGICFMSRFINYIQDYAEKGGEMPAAFDADSLVGMFKEYDLADRRTGREVYIQS